MKKLLFIVLISLQMAWGQEPAQVGNIAPNVTFQKILNFEKSSATLSDFKGKVVILDFWATWCAPCISSFPKLESIQSKLGNQLQILTITDDPKERIELFLGKRKMSLPVVLDSDRTITQIFPHRSIPHLVIIDKNGIVRAITTSSNITEETIQKVINGESISLEEKQDAMDFDPNELLSGNGNFSYQATFTPFKEGFSSFSNAKGVEQYTGRRILAVNLSPSTLFEIAYGFPPSIRTSIEVKEPSKLKWSKQNAVCFDLIVPEELGEKRFEIMKTQLLTYFPYTVNVEVRDKKVKVLSRIENEESMPESNPQTESTYSYSGKGLSAKASPMETLRDFLEGMSGVPVIDETGLIGKYDFEIPWYNENPAQIHEELKKIGLKLTNSEKKLDVLIIKDRE